MSHEVWAVAGPVRQLDETPPECLQRDVRSTGKGPYRLTHVSSDGVDCGVEERDRIHAKAIGAIVVGRQPDQDVPEVEFQCRLRSSDVQAEVGE